LLEAGVDAVGNLGGGHGWGIYVIREGIANGGWGWGAGAPEMGDGRWQIGWEIGEGVVGVGAFEVGYACSCFLFGIMGCRFAGDCGTECGFVFGG
jgi:hypothetical protein